MLYSPLLDSIVCQSNLCMESSYTQFTALGAPIAIGFGELSLSFTFYFSASFVREIFEQWNYFLAKMSHLLLVRPSFAGWYCTFLSLLHLILIATYREVANCLLNACFTVKYFNLAPVVFKWSTWPVYLWNVFMHNACWLLCM